MTEKLYPLRFKPVYKDYLWGGDRIPQLFGRDEPEGVYAESWEISDHPDGMSVVANGPLAGSTLSEILKERANEILGSKVAGNKFPLLIKLIDAAKPLSVQVHPNNSNAEKVSGEPKTEMWYFLGDDPDAQVYCGLKPGTDRAAFQQAIEKNEFEDILRAVPAEKGGAVFVPGGRIHAIDAGCLILEIQQNSNTTYRVYDWGRVGSDGKPRELHIAKAMQVIDFEDEEDPVSRPKDIAEGSVRGVEIEKSEFFKVDRFELDEEMQVDLDGSSFQALFVAEGDLVLETESGSEELPKGSSCLIPAALPGYRAIPKADSALFLRISLP